MQRLKMCLTVAYLGCCTSVTPVVRADGSAADDEANRMVLELHGENQRLKAEVESLRTQLELLRRELAETRARIDSERVPRGVSDAKAVAVQSAVSYDDLARVRVLDVNRDMKVAVVSGGMRAGMKPGMRFSVIRNDEAIAEIRLVDVREVIAGGMVEAMNDERLPEAGDRLVLKENTN